MLRNAPNQQLHIIAFDTQGRVSGEAANITCGLSIDGGSRVALGDNLPTEIGTTGEYVFELTQAETNGHALSFTPICSTEEVNVLAMPSNVIYTMEQVLAAISDLQDHGDENWANSPTAIVLPLFVDQNRRDAAQGTILLFVGERLPISVPVVNAANEPVDLTGKSLMFKVETQQRELVLSEAPSILEHTFTFTPNSKLTSSERELLWSLWEANEKAVLAQGKLVVKYTPKL